MSRQFRSVMGDQSAANHRDSSKLSRDWRKVHVNAIVRSKRFDCCEPNERVRKAGKFLTQNKRPCQTSDSKSDSDGLPHPHKTNQMQSNCQNSLIGGAVRTRA
ncbi:hypothetical protein RB3189 [Rhodopirellula baltica SH 1]|uniref:Uncharacterized protein n=1 Tax=Rhodopirellula baltica (strain DSM 10527 / NCIMB 13988 / SH1) TaxID=243090 RepID=Q7UUN5_RHOBA|nr:hypothetical protein RB3189 [Rhodopirellula baltica SH 1]